MASGARRGHREEVKVVLIDTRYVETDPRNFKSVVQGLTGKDSSLAWIEERGFTGTSAIGPSGSNIIPAVVGHNSSSNNNNNNNNSNNNNNNGKGGLDDNLRLTKGLSFNDLDRMTINELPLDEWDALWGPMHA